MSDETTTANSTRDLFLPLFLASLAFNLFLLTQVYNLWSSKQALQQQEVFMTQRLTAAQNDLAPARSMQTMLEGIAGDLLALGNTDPEIRKVVDKYQIRRK